MDTTTKIKIILIWSLLVACIIAFSWKEHVIFTDEVLFEEASFQMLETHNYLAPQLEGNVWLEKPPLYFWFTSLIYMFFGISPLTTRTGVILAAIGCLILTYVMGKKIFNQHSSLWAIAILVTTPLFLFFTKTANLDIPVTFFTLLTIYTYLRANRNSKWIVISAVSLALAFLTRSFLALTPLAIIAANELFLTPKKLERNTITTGLFIFLLIALPWNLIVYYLHPTDYLTHHLSFNLNQHLLAQTPGHEPLSLANFLINIFFRFNPLAFLAAYPIVAKKKKITGEVKLLYCWIVLTLLPLSLSTTRHEWYAIQALPPIAILAGHGMSEVRERIQNQLKNPLHWEMVNIYLTSILLAIPTAVFLSTFHQAKVVEVLEEFILETPKDTPLYNLEYLYIPNSTHFNPRTTPVIRADQLESIQKPIYLYLANDQQLSQVTSAVESCCTLQLFIEKKPAKVVRIDSLN